MPTIYITNSHKTARNLRAEATVEAEYGDITVKGTKITLAHHGVNDQNPCPCMGDNIVP